MLNAIVTNTSYDVIIGFGAGESEQKDCAIRLRRRGWECLNKKVRDELADNMVLIKLRNRLVFCINSIRG
jgi:hypothetical protein